MSEAVTSIDVSKIKKQEYMTKNELVGKNKKLESIFNFFDANKDNMLDATEIDKALRDIAESKLPENQLLKNELCSAGNFKQFSNKFNHLFHKKPFINGEISHTAQGFTGDCWLLSGLNALSGTKNGRAAIKNSISSDEEGNVSVELKGANKTYTFSKKEIMKYTNLGLTKGDYDVIVMEMAFTKHREEIIKTNRKNGKENHEYVGDGTWREPLYGGWPNEAIQLITGVKGESYTDREYCKRWEAKINRRPKEQYPIPFNKETHEMKDFDKIQEQIIANPERYAMGCIFKNVAGFSTSHAYSVKSFTKDKVIVVNPWNSSKDITMSKDEFLKNIYYFSFVDMQ